MFTRFAPNTDDNLYQTLSFYNTNLDTDLVFRDASEPNPLRISHPRKISLDAMATSGYAGSSSYVGTSGATSMQRCSDE